MALINTYGIGIG